MKLLYKARFLAVAALLLLPAQAMAQDSVSKHFPGTPNVPAGPGGTLELRATIAEPGFPDVFATFTLVGGAAGTAVAGGAAQALCDAARLAGYSSLTDCEAADCALLAGAGGVATCQKPAPDGSLKGFKIQRLGGSDTFIVSPFPPTGSFATKLKAVHSKTNAGNEVRTDLLSRFCLRVDRGGTPVNGTVNFSVRHFHGTPSGVTTSTFGVNTTGLSDTQLHQAIVDGLSAAVPNLELGVMDSPGMKCEFDGTFNGPLVSIWNLSGSGVVELGVGGLAGQNIIAESNGVAEEGDIPTLSEWGLIILAGILTVSAVWMLRRRSQAGIPA